MKNQYKVEGDILYMQCRFEGALIEVILDKSSLPKLIDYKGSWTGTRSCKEIIYIRNNYDVEGARKITYLHRFLTGCPKGLVVDHINHDPLDNRLSNLRIVSQSINSLNQRNKGEGVSFRRSRGKWVAKIQKDRKSIHLGYFETREEALVVRKAKEYEYFKEWSEGGLNYHEFS